MARDDDDASNKKRRDDAGSDKSSHQVWVASRVAIGNPIRTVAEDGPFFFRVNDGELGRIDVILDADGQQIEGTTVIGVTAGLLENLRGDIELHKMEHQFEEEANSILRRIGSSLGQVIRLLEQEMRDNKLCSRGLVHVPGGQKWSENGADWREFRGGRLQGGASVRAAFCLDLGWQHRVQTLLDVNEQPLLAMQHLYEAMRSPSSRIQWIEATVAAELAIKETLVRAEPRLGTLLTHVPSPPLSKLYGEVLRSVAGEESPFKAKLQRGAERRNHLIHRPEKTDLPPQDVVDYLGVVEDAIIHLIELIRVRQLGWPRATGGNTE